MKGKIASFLTSTAATDRAQVKRVFGPKFQDISGWRSFLRTTLNSNVSSQLSAAPARWSVKSFQALYVACWVHHPVEKGSYMINLGHLSTARRKVIEDACREHCYGRKSSHLSGAGRSASKGWEFLQGYKELLVQYESTKGQPYLFLKSEGHTTGITGIIPHMKSWVHKNKHGFGKLASPSLNALASPVSAWSGAVESRAAENYAKGYGKLLKKVLGVSGRQMTVREMMKLLFAKTRFPAPSNFATANNRQLGLLLARFTYAGSRYRLKGTITPDMINDLRRLAGTLQKDGDKHMSRVFREIRATPTEIDQSLAVFLT
ncbi:hypothetical protein MNBD_GAMMA15-1805 [hydrothermal vent metagenome]|uniref:Uncharacterized protein n=1 Tax=hydrothermal vent metagenome TaxID=652676 RepID=A0A3B0YTR4_9ZZZZ